MIYKCVNCGGNVVFDPQSGPYEMSELWWK